MTRHGHNEADRDAYGKEQRQHLHAAGRNPFALHAQQAYQGDDRKRRQRLAQIDFIAKDRIKVAVLQNAL